MKLLLLSVIWFPLTLLLLFLSFTTLLNFNSFPKNPKDYTNIYGNIFNSYGSRNFEVIAQIPSVDARVEVLKKFLLTYKSPLYPVAEIIVKQSDIYGIDYALIPAIAMQESQGCKIIPPGSHNCWGFGIYGDKKIHFDSYESAISAVAKTIKEAYIKRGLTNPTLLEDRWTPSSEGNWSYSVNFFIGKIRQIEKTYLNT